MHVLVLASQKGGAGKTTLSRHLAVEAERVGQGPVVLIDADPQGGLAGWWNRRTADTPVFFASRLEDLPKHVEQARAGGVKLIIIDTPPQATTLIRAVVGLADLVLIPTRPSPDDLDAVGRTIDIVDDAHKPMRLLSGSGVVAWGHATRASMRAPSRALPRRRALCTN